MAYYSYNEVTRALIEISDFVLSLDANLPVSYVEVTKADLLNLYEWDSSSLSFVTKSGRLLSKKEFLKKFTPTEYSTIKAVTSSNGIVDYYWQLFMVAENINLNDADTIQGIYTLEHIGLLSEGRAAEILA
jgi:hypothetical protein